MFLVIAFVTVSFLGVFDCMSRIMHPVGMPEIVNRDHCPPIFAQEGDCSMELLEHLSVWQGVFRVDVQPGVLSLFMLLVVVSCSTFFAVRVFTQIKVLIKPKLYLSLHRDLKLYNFLQIILARGILASRVYA